ncbi:hypothetical protein TEA_029372 [Camellia sinensis var. sinensis]|uniref:Cation/H+ exchanger transmembrane domain-containing protein n=1 Tax=Camellia sinensis var. sinensis TaxID=542762 RepID=A0A4S4DY37_CAMSN|nr:hypothetical protein TEA_029372 [Camellia sinensis var. sinensis]
MGSQILKISPFSSPRALIFNPTPLSRLLPKSNTPTRLCNTQLRQFSSKPIFINTPISQPGFGLLFRQSERRFRGGVVAMAASGSVQKSDEEWRAILSPEQFRILRKKGTDYMDASYMAVFLVRLVSLVVLRMVDVMSIDLMNAALLLVIILLNKSLESCEGIPALGNMTSSLLRESILVLDVELLSTSQQLNSTPVVVGPLSMKFISSALIVLFDELPIKDGYLYGVKYLVWFYSVLSYTVQSEASFMSVNISMLDSIACFYDPKGYDIINQTSTIRANSHVFSNLSRQFFSVPYTYNRRVGLPLFSMYQWTSHCFSFTANASNYRPLLSSLISGERGFHFSNHRRDRKERFCIHAALDVASAVEVINDLGLDTLTLLAVTVIVVPAFKTIKASPILGFFFAGVVLNQFGLIRNLTDVKVLSEWGILFLLFEMGLELSLARLKALAKFAFGMGLTQVVLSTLAFTAFELPPNGAIGTRILEFLFHSRPDLVNIRSVDEAIVIGAALSLSSSAFVLQKVQIGNMELADTLDHVAVCNCNFPVKEVGP